VLTADLAAAAAAATADARELATLRMQLKQRGNETAAVKS
jgi:hypothetical protein